MLMTLGFLTIIIQTETISLFEDGHLTSATIILSMPGTEKSNHVL